MNQELASTQATPPTAEVAPPTAPNNRWARMFRPSLSWLLVALIVCVNISVWRAGHPQRPAADFEGTISGLAYNAFGRYDSPITKTYPNVAQIEGDLSLLAGTTRRIRTYSSAEFPELPALAERQGLKLTAGVWLDRRTENVTLEIAALRQALRDTRSIERVIAGNETLLHSVFTVKELTQQLDALRAQVRVPVSTAEPWHVWLRYPELAKHVDFITVHLLPYWEGVPGAVAMKYAMQRYEEVKKAFPNKHILIGEIGWPSQGDRYDGAYTSPETQAQFIREFLSHNKGKHIDYFLMEAIDQPWKTANEGRVGAYWGIFHSDRTPKFELLGPVESDPQWFQKSVLATLLALPLMIMFVRRFRHLRWPSKLMMLIMVQAVSSLAVWMVALPFDLYLRWSDWLALCVLAPTLSIMSAILLSQGFEFAEMFWRGNLQRVYPPRAPDPIGAQPFVSIHLACCNEPPEMVIATIASIERLNYANFELLVIDNNTKDPARWQPVRDYMERLDERFRFFHLPSWPGFKAGALNFALTEVDARAEVIAVVDADYVVNSRWLASLVGYFNDPNVAVVQSPQAHRGWSRQIFHRMMNWEFEGFFRIGMHHRNERDAIIQHGTMTMIRASALREHGQWSEWCICEDSELGLRMMRAGYSTVYCGEVMGEGLTPNSFEAFKKQRRRWALGAMQIMKAHWRSLFFASELSRAQRYHFVSGWLSWFGDALHLIFALGAMLYTIGIIAAPHLFSLPIMLFMAPLVVFFCCKAMFGPLLYLRRVPGTLGDAIGAAIAGMALSHGIALGVLSGLTQKKGVFEITGKGKIAAGASGWLNRLSQYQAVREEAFLLLGLLSCIAGIAISRKGNHVESALWMTILALQAIPYMATLLCAWLSRLPDTPALPELRAQGENANAQPAKGLPQASLIASPVQIASAQ
jgi:exo-beta-1,3-glucanase (GH17 family)/cellulose synthase/poly-beta-1,6-N-acetylglucosamine synthase-like glycosyltransferase